MATNSTNSGWTVPRWVWEVLGKSLDMLFYLGLVALIIGFLLKPVGESPWIVLAPILLSPIAAVLYLKQQRGGVRSGDTQS